MKTGTKVKIKSLQELHKITNIGFQKAVQLKNGLIFTPLMLCYAGQMGIITEIAEPGPDNKLTSESYKIGNVDIYWSKELFIEVSEVF